MQALLLIMLSPLCVIIHVKDCYILFHSYILVPCWVEEFWIVDIVRTIIYTIQILMKLFIHQLVPFHYPYHSSIVPL